MQELLDTMDGWRAEGAGIGRAVVVRTFGSAPRPEGAVLLRADDGRIAGSRERRLRRGGGGRGDRAGPQGRPQPGHPLRDQRRGGLGRRPRVRRDDRRARGAGARRRAAVDRRPCPRTRGGDHPPVDAPPPAFGRHEPGDGAPPTGRIVVGADGSMDGTLGSRPTTRRSRAAAADALLRGTSRTVTVGDRQVFVEAFPVRPRLVIVGRGRGRPVARGVREGARLRGGRRGRPGVVRDPRAVPATASTACRGLAGRGGGRDRARAGRRRRGADPRREVRRARDRRGPPPRLPLRRGGGVEEDTGRPPRAAARGRRDAAELARLRGPIGLDLGGRNPSETALAIMAEVVAERYGQRPAARATGAGRRGGGRMSGRR